MDNLDPDDRDDLAWCPDLDLSPRAQLGRAVDGLATIERMLAELHARRALLVDQARLAAESLQHESTTPDGPQWTASTVARKTAVAEIACVLRMPDRSAETLVGQSEILLHELTSTRAALIRGELSYRHAAVLVDQAMSLPAESRRGFERSVLPLARTLTVAKFERRARTLRERLHSESIAERRTKSVADRTVTFEPARDGMAWLSLYQPAEIALAAYRRLTGIAHSLQGPDESRTLTQLRADAAADLLLDGEVASADGDVVRADGDTSASLFSPGLGRGIRPTVMVTVPVLTLLGHDEEPAELEGYGPIDADTARRLAAHAPSFTRILTHPESGTVLSVGRDSYAVPADLRRWLRVQDGTCRFPGCSRAAGRCDLDHCIDWQNGGTTSVDNLAHLCRHHHRLKHQTDVDYRHSGGGVLEWTTASRRRYITEPAVRIGPARWARPARP